MNHHWVLYAPDSKFQYCDLCGCGNYSPPPECSGAKALAMHQLSQQIIPKKKKDRRGK